MAASTMTDIQNVANIFFIYILYIRCHLPPIEIEQFFIPSTVENHQVVDTLHAFHRSGNRMPPGILIHVQHGYGLAVHYHFDGPTGLATDTGRDFCGTRPEIHSPQALP